MIFHDWRKFWWKIDLLGILLGIGLGIAYIFLSKDSTSSKFNDIWANGATEIFGAWVSVRLIGAIIDSKATYSSVRHRLIDNFNYFEHNILPLKISRNLDNETIEILKRENHYFDIRWGKRIKYLYKDERMEALELRKLQGVIVEKLDKRGKLINLGVAENKTPLNVIINNTNQLDDLANELKKLATDYEKLLETFRLNIWNETHPDRSH
jgi:hypothetical protein